MPISAHESYRLAYDHIHGLTLEFWFDSTTVSDIVAKTCECENRGRKVTYSLIDTYHSLCHDKKDLILGQIEACQRLVKYIAKDGRDEIDRQAILSEIDELKMVLDLIQ